MTNRRRSAHTRAVRRMKAILVVGSVAASLLGAQLLAAQAQPAAVPALMAASENGQERQWRQAASEQTLALAPVPTAAAPLRPVTRSRSSR